MTLADRRTPHTTAGVGPNQAITVGPNGLVILKSSQYTAIRYTDRLAEAGLQASIGTIGNSYDNALAETVNGLYKAELVFWEGPWKGADDLELATLGWVDWFNHTRLHSALGYRPPAEVESEYYRQIHSTEQPLVGEPAL